MNSHNIPSAAAAAGMERLSFWAEWFQPEANVSRSFFFSYFPADSTVEMFEHKIRKTFLKRTKIHGITEENVYLGAKLNILGRQIVIVDYADAHTKNVLTKKRERSFCFIKPEAIAKMDQILSRLISENVIIGKCLMVRLSASDVMTLYAERCVDPELTMHIEHLTSGNVVVLEVMAKDIINKMNILTGPEDPAKAEENSPNSIISKFGKDSVLNAFYCSPTSGAAINELEYFFPPNRPSPFNNVAKINGNCTLAIIKPHAIKEGKLGRIISVIYENNFKITAMKQIHLERKNCEEFYEVYKGVVQEYTQMTIELSNGPCVAMEITPNSSKVNAHSEFRYLCGPVDVEIGRKIRPQSIRTKFGTDKILNAIHCTDLPEDTALELEYFFKILN